MSKSTDEKLNDIFSKITDIKHNYKSDLTQTITNPRNNEISKIEAKYDVKKIENNSTYSKKVDEVENSCFEKCKSLKRNTDKQECSNLCTKMGVDYDKLICEN